MDYASMLMESETGAPDGLGSEYWLAPGLPFALRGRVEGVFELLAHLPLEQPLAVVADAGKTMAVNAPLLRLLGEDGPALIGQMWSRVMPAWPDRARRFRRDGEQIFEDHLTGAGGDQVWVRVSLGPIAERGEQRAMAYVLFISRARRGDHRPRGGAAAAQEPAAARRHADRLRGRGRPRRRS